MTLRVSRFGRYTGAEFWACSAFPDCLGSASRIRTDPGRADYGEEHDYWEWADEESDTDSIECVVEREELIDEALGDCAENASRSDETGWYYGEEDDDSLLAEGSHEVASESPGSDELDDDDEDSWGDDADLGDASDWRPEWLMLPSKESGDAVVAHVLAIGGDARIRLHPKGGFLVRVQCSRDLSPDVMHSGVHFGDRDRRWIRNAYTRWENVDFIAWKVGRSQAAVVMELTRQRLMFNGSRLRAKRGLNRRRVKEATIALLNAARSGRRAITDGYGESQPQDCSLVEPFESLAQSIDAPRPYRTGTTLRMLAEVDLTDLSIADLIELALQLNAPRLAYLLALQIRSPAYGFLALEAMRDRSARLTGIRNALDSYLKHAVDRGVIDYFRRWRDMSHFRTGKPLGQVAYRPSCSPSLLDEFRVAVVRFMGGWDRDLRVIEIGLQSATDPDRALNELIPYANGGHALACWMAMDLIAQGVNPKPETGRIDVTEVLRRQAMFQDPPSTVASVVCRVDAYDEGAAFEMNRRLTRKPRSDGPSQ